MALIRKVKVHENSRTWAYVECSDENPKHIIILGSQEFSTKEEAEEFAKGFAPDSYQWVEPVEIKRNRLLAEKEKLQKRLVAIEEELNKTT